MSDDRLELQSSTRFHNRMLWLIAVIYPAWSIYLHYFQPNEYDEPLGRTMVGALALGFWLAQKNRPQLRKHAPLLSLIALLALNVHFQWLIYRNQLSDIYMFGSAVVASGTSVMFDRTRYYKAYAAVSIALSFVVAALLFRQSSKASMYFVMMTSIQVVVYFSLAARFEALKSLKDARELNLEMRRQILESELHSAQAEKERFQELSMHDSVTGLPNRLYLNQQIKNAFERYREEGIPFTMLYIDLDRFKEVNDTHGHAAGDQVLVEAGQRIRQTLRRADIVARLGGDEFVAILAGVDDTALTARISGDIVAAIHRPIAIGDKVCRVGASVGEAICPTHATTIEALQALADKRMYETKRLRKSA